jgi:hypothetical protein
VHQNILKGITTYLNLRTLVDEMMITLQIFKNNTTKASFLFCLIIISAYSPVIFLGQSYNQSWSISPAFLGYDAEKPVQFQSTIDPAADFEQNWPIMKLDAKLLSEGKLPLWDPYIGGGQPLAADTINYIYSPLVLGFLLPVQYWDLALLGALWAAGMFTFLFLRNLGLNFPSSISGGMIYMLSGAFTWYLTHTDVAVMVFTPLILYSVEKIAQNKNPKYILLLGISFFVSFLGAHLESIVLQVTLITLYFLYRTIFPAVLSYRQRKKDDLKLLSHDAKGISIRYLSGFIGGIGLASFFILPAYEFIKNAYIGHDTIQGLLYDKLPVLLSAFVPYSLGQIHVYWSSTITQYVRWDGLWGYVGMFALFFSILSVYLSKNNENLIHKYTPVFFLGVSIFFMMKTVGVPVVNLIGALPIFNFIVFTRYAGIIVPIGFAIAAAFGIDLLYKSKISRKGLGLTTILSIVIVMLLSLPFYPFIFSHDAQFPFGLSRSDVEKYFGLQILQASLFALTALFFSLRVVKNKSSIIGIIPLVFLELFLYIPVGLSPVFVAYKTIVVLAGMFFITIVSLKPNFLTWNLNSNQVKISTLFVILIVIISVGVLLSHASPTALYSRFDSLKQNPLTNFLKENLGDKRMFSFEYALGPNYPAAYDINTLGIMAALNIDSFHTFNHNFLDKDAWTSNLGYRSWSDSYGPIHAIQKFNQNKKFYDFLGVKYIITEGYSLTNHTTEVSHTKTYVRIMSGENNIGERFTSTTSEISSLGISFGTHMKQNQGQVILIIDSIPYNKQYHRESIINTTTIKNAEFNEFKFRSPLTNVSKKEFYLSLQYPQTNDQNALTVFTYKHGDHGFNTVTNDLHGEFYQNGMMHNDTQMVFSIIGNQNDSSIFKFHDINVFENKDAYPRAYLVNKFHVTNKGTAQDYLLQNSDFDLRHNVVLEKQPPSDIVTDLNSSILDSTSNAKIVLYDTNKVSIRTNTNAPSMLILTDTYYPGWKAYVDNKETEIYRADGLVRAVFVPAGDHTVEFSYMPLSFLSGIGISLTTALTLILFAYYARKPSLKR